MVVLYSRLEQGRRNIYVVDFDDCQGLEHATRTFAGPCTIKKASAVAKEIDDFLGTKELLRVCNASKDVTVGKVIQELFRLQEESVVCQKI